MQPFDCLTAPLLGERFLEASAGTGKTFAIEHIVARLIREHHFSLEEILVVTFTRAAARELKARIRNNLEKLQLQHALFSFDRAQIFTIHGFCAAQLREQKPRAPRGSSSKIEHALRCFFELHLSSDVVFPQQLRVLLHWAGSVEELGWRLQKRSVKNQVPTAQEFERKFQQLLNQTSALDEFEQYKQHYKSVKGDLVSQAHALQTGDFRTLLREKGSIFRFFSPENRRAKAPPHELVFFDWAREHVLPIIEQALDPETIFQAVAAAWKPFYDRILEAEHIETPDKLLTDMHQATQDPAFCHAIQKKYRAVLIDEFQDTDPIQWDIFRTLFLGKTEAFYLIGDPKQSIYRFRNADVYTYMAAKQAVSEHFHLDTNYRSSKQLIGALNRLLDRNWFQLPKLGVTVPYHAVKAGLPLETNFPDEKKAVHCWLFEDEEHLFARTVQEITVLRAHTENLSAFAVLVKDRYQAAKIEQCLQEAGIAVVSRSQELLTQAVAFQCVDEVFLALHAFKDLGRAKTVLAGPLAGMSAEELLSLDHNPFAALRQTLDEQGLAALLHTLLQTNLSHKTVQETAASHGIGFYSDLRQTFELFLSWEHNQGFSFEGLFRFVEQLRHLDPDAAPRRMQEQSVDGVQVLTMHKSKGLEFDVVFALGVAMSAPAEDSDAEAEQLRQLYVTLTRAKRRLYLPIPTTPAKETVSPIEQFCRVLAPDGSWLKQLSQETDISVETVVPTTLTPHTTSNIVVPVLPPQPPVFPLKTSYILSFTSIAQPTINRGDKKVTRCASEAQPDQSASVPNEEAMVKPWSTKRIDMAKPQQADCHLFITPVNIPNVKPLYIPEMLPAGAETGILIHRIFERLFLHSTPLETLVEQELCSTPLAPWTQAVILMVQNTLQLPLPTGFCLQDIRQNPLLVEAEFLFQHKHNFLKGVIDLLFVHKDKVYFVDWKTNLLPDYSEQTMRTAMLEHEYSLQASIYREAIERTAAAEFGGSLYLFVRGPGVLHFHPERYGH